VQTMGIGKASNERESFDNSKRWSVANKKCRDMLNQPSRLTVVERHVLDRLKALARALPCNLQNTK
jgi:hypothetical protein